MNALRFWFLFEVWISFVTFFPPVSSLISCNFNAFCLWWFNTVEGPKFDLEKVIRKLNHGMLINFTKVSTASQTLLKCSSQIVRLSCHYLSRNYDAQIAENFLSKHQLQKWTAIFAFHTILLSFWFSKKYVKIKTRIKCVQWYDLDSEKNGIQI